MRACGTKERRVANMARFSYNMYHDPRFNGEHAAKGYERVGPDPCDPHKNRGKIKNIGIGKPHIRLGRGMRRSNVHCNYLLFW